MKRRRAQPATRQTRSEASCRIADSDSHVLRELEENPDFMLMMLDIPISFHRAYVPMTGMVTAALMLSYAAQTCVDGETQDGITDLDGWFTKTQQQWTDEIGLSKDEIATARSRLRELGALEERLVRDASGFKSFLQYRVNFDRVSELLMEQAARMRRDRSAQSAH